MSNQERLESLLKKKGIGPEGSKSLVKDELKELIPLFFDPGVSLTTKATLLTALLLLEPNPDEREWVNLIHDNPYKLLPEELQEFIVETRNPFLQLIQQLISKKELTAQECQQAMQFLFDEKTPEYLKGPFLEGERLKRESFTENKTFFDFMYAAIPHKEIKSPILIDICDSYDGCNRSRNFSVFTAVLLASAGFPTIVHGIDEVAPKMGYTTHKILKAAGKNPLISVNQAADYLDNSEIGWAYLDQKIYFEKLFRLKTMRKEMVKRPFLATFEKLLQPVRAASGNCIVTGYTHPHYKEELVKQLKVQGKCKNAIIIKGVEGSTHMSLSKASSCVVYNGNEITECTVSPDQYGLPMLEAKQDKSLTEQQSLEEGLAALKGEKNYARENMLYLSLVLLSRLELINNMEETSKKLKQLIDSGQALSHWEKGNK